MAPLATPDAAHASASGSSQQTLDESFKYGANNYHPLPVVFAKAKGIHVWDPEGRRYMDFLSAYSAVNQGHCHPRLVEALTRQASTCALSSRAFYNDVYGRYAKYITEYFGFDMVLPMNTGAEAVETALKLARKWAYEVKGVAPNEAIIFSAANNFHGRTIGIISMSTDPEATTNFGPFVPNVGPVCPETGKVIRYNHAEDLEAALARHGPKVAAFLVEPIQGEAGIFVPDEDYLRRCYEACKKHNVLFIADEIQTGLARSGKMLAIEYAGIKPDVLILGKALSGGMYPVSAVLANKPIMGVIRPGEHGSTYGGNPIGCAVAMEALQILKDEHLTEKAFDLGEKFRAALTAINSPAIELVRGRGLLNAIIIDEAKAYGKTAWHICLMMKKYGLLAKPTHQNIIRLAPPLVITEAELMEGVAIIKKVLDELPHIKVEDIVEEQPAGHHDAHDASDASDAAR
ncbi:hypothetical protein CXG81DRAFT_13976 [Caulochytrium protostelioides]|uniref:Ornithine aminotransferase n=1 Tax=Caulochytrium protostelioides TaxID=1555241 RepID=A0A4P9X451_9FUNG|nr:hypothetical protein CXG81DRAFT_13976 [Caulochytrium protostelioides]|eukprot:RKO99814.1 hypothetical protein CXG81DRAFT_13976 [Caulochytrium protostelioides]